jgi:hypothetical protein
VVLLGEAITPAQATAGAVVLLGLGLAGREGRRPADVFAKPSWPDAGPSGVPGAQSDHAIGIR